MAFQLNKSLSEWSAVTRTIQYESYNRNINIDVCIVGGGITGLTCALMLSKQGREAIVVDNGSLGSSENSYSAAQVIDDGMEETEIICGTENLKFNNDCERKAILRIREIVESEGKKNDINVIDGYLIFKPDGPADLMRGVYSNLPNQAQLHLMRYLNTLCERFIARGGKIFSDSNINIKEENGASYLVNANGCIIKAQNVIVTSSSENNGIGNTQGAFHTYVIAGSIPDGYVPRDLYWDKGNPYQYIRIKSADCSR